MHLNIPLYPTFPTVEEWSYTIPFPSQLGAQVIAPDQIHFQDLPYETRPPLAFCSTPTPPYHALSLAVHSPPPPSTRHLVFDFRGDVSTEPASADTPSLLPPSSLLEPAKTLKKKGPTVAEKRATIRERNRLSKRAQRERQAQKVGLLEEKVAQQAEEIEELRQKLEKREREVLMLVRELQEGKKGFGDDVSRVL